MALAGEYLDARHTASLRRSLGKDVHDGRGVQRVAQDLCDLRPRERTGLAPKSDLDVARVFCDANADTVEPQVIRAREVGEGSGNRLDGTLVAAVEQGTGIDFDNLRGVGPVHSDERTAD